MATNTPPKTPNLGLPLNLHGHYRVVQGVKEGFGTLDTEIAALKARVLVLETELNDSNSAAVDIP